MSSSRRQGSNIPRRMSGSNDTIKTVRKLKARILTPTGNLSKFSFSQKSNKINFFPGSKRNFRDFDNSPKDKSYSHQTSSFIVSNSSSANAGKSSRRFRMFEIAKNKFSPKMNSDSNFNKRSNLLKKNYQRSMDLKLPQKNKSRINSFVSGSMNMEFNSAHGKSNRSKINLIKMEIENLKKEFKVNKAGGKKKSGVVGMGDNSSCNDNSGLFDEIRLVKVDNQFSEHFRESSPVNLDSITIGEELLRCKSEEGDDTGTKPQKAKERKSYFSLSDRSNTKSNKLNAFKYNQEPIKEEDENNFSSSSEDYYLKYHHPNLKIDEENSESQDFIDLNRYRNTESDISNFSSSIFETKNEQIMEKKEDESIAIEESVVITRGFSFGNKQKDSKNLVSSNTILKGKDCKKTLKEVLQLSSDKIMRRSFDPQIGKKKQSKKIFKKNFQKNVMRLDLDLVKKRTKNNGEQKRNNSNSRSKGFWSSRDKSGNGKKGKFNVVGLQSILSSDKQYKISHTERHREVDRVSFVEFKKKYMLNSRFKSKNSSRKPKKIHHMKKRSENLYNSMCSNFKKNREKMVYSIIGGSNVKKRNSSGKKTRKVKTSRDYGKKSTIKNLEIFLSQKSSLNLSNFEIVEHLKKCKYGDFFKAIEKKTKKKVVLKKISKLAIKMLERSCHLEKETEIHSSLDNPFIAKFIGQFSTNKFIYHVLEDFDVETLALVIQKDSNPGQEKYVKCIVKALLTAANYLHKRGIVHRDLNPDVVHIANGLIKIVDFSSSTPLITRNRNRFLGKNEYAAPELLLDSRVSFKNDSWTIGVIAFEMMTGFIPEINLTKHNKEVKIPDYLGFACRDFLSRILAINDRERLSVVDALDHRFLKKED